MVHIYSVVLTLGGSSDILLSSKMISNVLANSLLNISTFLWSEASSRHLSSRIHVKPTIKLRLKSITLSTANGSEIIICVDVQFIIIFGKQIDT